MSPSGGYVHLSLYHYCDSFIHSFIHLLYSINPSWVQTPLDVELVNGIYSIAKHNHLHCILILMHTMLQIILIMTTTIIFRHSVHILIFVYINKLPLLLIFLTASLFILFIYCVVLYLFHFS